MCLDGNSAELSANYISAQLKALWDNAKKCAKHTTHARLDYKSSAYEKSRNTRALREFHYLTRKSKAGLHEDDLFFSATFGQPKLKFICNHFVFFYLKIESGHLNLDIKDAVKSGRKARHDCNRAIDNLELEFHVPIIRTNIKGRDSKIGNASAEHLIQMQVLKLEEAKLIMLNPDASLGAEVKDALKFYMTHYLSFLKTSGNHVFFDLADFDSDSDRLKSNYSLVRTDKTNDLLKGIRQELLLLGKYKPDVLAQFYKAAWTVASALVNVENWGSLQICLATICSDWLVGAEVKKPFHINFETPTVEVLCPYEVILKFHLKDLAFFERTDIGEDAEALHEFHDWTVAFVVKVFQNESGMIQLDFETARFSRKDSCFGAKEEEFEYYIQLMIDFFSVDYLDLLVSYSLHLSLGASGEGSEVVEYHSGSGSWSNTSEGGTDEFHRRRGHAMLWMERIQRMCLHSGFDEVIVLSEESINLVLQKRVKEVISSFISRDKLFEMKVQSLKIRLLSNGKAVLYIQADGHIAVRKQVSQQPRKFWGMPIPWLPVTEAEEYECHPFESITLAYEVDLKFVGEEHFHHEVERVVLEYFEETRGNRTTSAWKLSAEITTGTVDSSFKHLILDLKNARYNDKLSDIAALDTGDNYTERLKTVKTYVPMYFKSLVSYGHNIVHSVTMVGRDTPYADESLFAFTDVDFKVLTKRRVTMSTSLRDRQTVEAPFVMIYGMCTGRSMPAFVDTWSLGWLPVGRSAVGTLTLSNRVFLERCILNYLTDINSHTTLVPKSVDVVDGHWHVSLTTWAEREARLQSGRKCQWTLGRDANGLTYQWHHRDEWKHKHEDSVLDNTSGEYALECSTRNNVRVPTVYNRDGLKIQVEGKSTVRVSGKTDDQRWKNKTVFSWSATVSLDIVEDALEVKFEYKEPVLAHDPDECSGHCPVNIAELHRKCFAMDIRALKEFVPRLKHALEENWDYCAMGTQRVTLHDPVFTRRGDFVCELELHSDPRPLVMFDPNAWRKLTESVCEFKSAPTLPLLNGKAGLLKGIANGNGNSKTKGYFASKHGKITRYSNSAATPALSPSASFSEADDSTLTTPSVESGPILYSVPKAKPLDPKVYRADDPLTEAGLAWDGEVQV